MSSDEKRKAEYVKAVVRGAGFMPWQTRESTSEAEEGFREKIERRKDRMLRSRVKVKHPFTVDDEGLKRVRRNIRSADWARAWYSRHKRVADHVIAQPEGYEREMISELTPWYDYGMTCPNCVHVKSQEGTGGSLIQWDYQDPERFRCRYCGQIYPSRKYPETADLVCPRQEQTLTFFLNEGERTHSRDRTGKYAYHWASRAHPMHMSFSGVIRQCKAYFMIAAAESLALCYRIEGDARYAESSVQTLVRLSECYRKWLYHDYWNSIADCDPMYAAWHDMDLPLVWKKHLCTDAFGRDTLKSARMLQNYWGGGRLHPSCDSATLLVRLARAYDLVHAAEDTNGNRLWTRDARTQVERDLFMEWLMGGEPFLGGGLKASNVNNKAGRVYWPMAAVARCLGIPEWADTALRGFEAQQAKSVTYDGFSHESPGYTFSSASYFGGLIGIAEALHGFRWPRSFKTRTGVVNLYESEERFRLLLRTAVDHQYPDGTLLPASDTSAGGGLAQPLVEVGLNRCPEYYAGTLGAIGGKGAPSEYAVLNLNAGSVNRERRQGNRLELPERHFPAWMTAILRHGQGDRAAALALLFSPTGGHRHSDNLAISFMDRGDEILGDLGYVGDTQMNSWIRSTQSHNLVVVDNGEQLFRSPERRPQFRMMVTSPRASVVEASSQAYGQCREYRRTVTLIKGPDGQTFALDIFRVKGGSRHDYRLFSELASSDASDGELRFEDIEMPPEPPLPDIGASVADEDIFGLRDTRTVDCPGAPWRAVWKQRGRRYRLWMLSQADAVQASNGPGQKSRNQAGRRVRYLGAVRTGEDLASCFVAVHEPSGLRGKMPVRKAVRLTVPSHAGPDAVAIKIESSWGTYRVFSEFRREAEVDGVSFKGRFGILCETPEGSEWVLTSGAVTMAANGIGFRDKPAVWSGKVLGQTEQSIRADTDRPRGWPRSADGVEGYVRVKMGGTWTGYPVKSTSKGQIQVDRFPLQKVSRFEMPAVRWEER
jgi:hypothetical protein